MEKDNKLKETQDKDLEFDAKFGDKANTPMSLDEFNALMDAMEDFYE